MIGASLSEPHINSTAVRKFYMEYMQILYETVGIMGHPYKDGSFRFGGHCIIPKLQLLPAKLNLLSTLF